MHLINTRTLSMKEFVGPPPPYAILSHTWGDDEVSFADQQYPEKRARQAGFRKILLTCQQALNDGIDWAWIDTCCIDKSSSADLSEAINSMFKWYANSAVCYAYLEDWPSPKEVLSAESSYLGDALKYLFRRCRWFSRGWTLQDLIAPKDLRFYVNNKLDRSNWRLLGHKKDLVPDLHVVTRIPQSVLYGQPLYSVSVAARMSWAAGRETAREEDIAYCLMGIFDINMPMIYGEGRKAFLRLQEEIIKEYNDHTIFAWKASRKSATDTPYRGILADSPDEFAGSSNIIPMYRPLYDGLPTTMTNKGLSMMTREKESGGSEGENGIITLILRLSCRVNDVEQGKVSIQLAHFAQDMWVRQNPSQLIFSTDDTRHDQNKEANRIFIMKRFRPLVT